MTTKARDAKLDDHKELTGDPRFHSVVLVLSSHQEEEDFQNSLNARKLVAHTIQVTHDRVTGEHQRAVLVHNYRAGCQWCNPAMVWFHAGD